MAQRVFALVAFAERLIGAYLCGLTAESVCARLSDYLARRPRDVRAIEFRIWRQVQSNVRNALTSCLLPARRGLASEHSRSREASHVFIGGVDSKSAVYMAKQCEMVRESEG